MPINFQTQSGVRHESRGGSASSRGITVSATTANTKTGWTNLGATTNFDWEQMHVVLGGATTVTANLTVDIGIGTGTGSFVLIQDLRFDTTRVADSGQSNYFVPVHVPKGSQLSARVSGSVASSQIDITLIGSSRGLRGMPGYSRAFAISTATLSRGITLLATTGTNVEGNYSVLTTNCPRFADAIFGHVGLAADVTKTVRMSWLIDIAYGTATGAVFNVIEDIYFRSETTLDTLCDSIFGPFPVSIGNTFAVQARAQTTSTATADNTLDIMLYGLEP